MYYYFMLKEDKNQAIVIRCRNADGLQNLAGIINCARTCKILTTKNPSIDMCLNKNDKPMLVAVCSIFLC